ncbi:MAG TPA: M56 family metallopeptidase [Candidatus Acidoferrum sp.]|nr:M56 family metallopeptidase [Candidatus Acidoferrum sp.]
METLLQANATLADFVLFSSLKASALIALVLAMQWLLRRYLSAGGRYLLWAAVVTSLMVPVGFAIKLSLPVQLAQVQAADVIDNAPLSENSLARGDASWLPASMVAVQSRDTAGFQFGRDLLPLLWLGGVVLFLATVAARQICFARIVRAATPAGPALQQLLEDCRELTRCRARVRLLMSPHVDAPLVTGFWRPLLLLPVGIEGDLTPAQLRHVFLHELVHVKSLDIATNWLLTLLQALHWFNPVVWFGFNCLRQDRELACDARTLRLLAADEGAAYGHTLLQLSQAQARPLDAALALGIVDDHAQLKRRIAMIVRNALPARFHVLLTGALLLAFGAVALSEPMLDVAVPVSAATEEVAVPALPVAAATPTTMPTSAPAPVVSPVVEVSAPVAKAVTAKHSVAARTAVVVAEPAAAVSAGKPQPQLLLAMADNTETKSAPMANAPAAQPGHTIVVQQPETITIVGRSLREKVWNAEIKAYDIFNKFNDQKIFRIECSIYSPTGTRLKRQVCKPAFELAAEQAHGVAYLLGAQGAGGAQDESIIPPIQGESMEAVFARYLPAYKEKMQQVAREHPEFMAAIKQYSDLKQEYLGERAEKKN